MKQFLKVMQAKIEHRNEALLWGIARGHSRTGGHKAAACTASIDEGDIRRVLVHESYVCDANAATFAEFLKDLTAMHPIASAGIVHDDEGTKEALRRAGITPAFVPLRPLDAELLVPVGLSSKDLAPYQDVIFAAAAMALQDSSGISFV